jgi:hypothetical protein
MSTVQGGQGNIVTNGLVLNLDAANPRSYPQPYNGTTWQNIAPVSSSLTGSLTNGPLFATSGSGCIAFDGVNDYINIPGILIPSNSTFTLNTWVYYASGNGAYPMIVSNFGSNVSMLFGINIGTGGKAGFNLFLNYLETSNNTVPTANQWYNVVGNYDGTNIRLYINGTLTSTSPSGSYGGITGIALGYGTAGGNSYWKGNISVAQVYNCALSASEVLQNFNATRARFGV